jgi:hypothetical protein
LAIVPLSGPFTLEHLAVGDAVVVCITETIAPHAWRK